jgi:hypothetical protein
VRCLNSDIDLVKIIESVRNTEALTKVLLTQQQNFLLLFNQKKVINKDTIKAKDQINENGELAKFLENTQLIDEGIFNFMTL